jgi:hypothetical protein
LNACAARGKQETLETGGFLMKPRRSAHLSRREVLAATAAVGTNSAIPTNSAWAVVDASRTPAVDHKALATAVLHSIRNVVREGLTDVFQDPIEVQLLRQDHDLQLSAAQRTAEIIAAGSFSPSNFSQLELVDYPKRDYGSRRACAAIDPLDTLVYLALAVIAAPLIEGRRVPIEDETVFSYRFAPSQGRLFNARYHFSSYRQATGSRQSRSRFAVACDVADFYPSVTPETVHRALTRCSVPPFLCDYLADLLTYWSGSGSRGLPVGSNASRILAEASLIPVDAALKAEGIDYVRFVDDFMLFAPDRESADKALSILSENLAQEKLVLSPSKTRIVELSNAPASSVQEQGARERPTDQPLQLARKRRPNLPPYAIFRGLPRRFRAANRQELARIRSAADVPDLSILLEGTQAPPWQVRRLLRLALYTGRVDIMKAIPELLVRYPEFSSYVASALAQCSQAVPADLRAHLAGELGLMLSDPDTPTFVRLELIALCGTQAYRNRDALETYLRDRSDHPTGVCFRAALDGLRQTGGIPANVHAACAQGDIWTQRALLADPTTQMITQTALRGAEPFALSLMKLRSSSLT